MIRGTCTNIYLRPISYFSLVVTLAVTMIALCTGSWYSTKYKNKTIFVGLWNICTGKADDFTGKCNFLPEPNKEELFRIHEGHLTAVRALYSMSVMLLVGALGYPPFFKQMSSTILKIGFMALLAAVAGTCSFIAMLVLTHDMNSLPVNIVFGYSYILGWVCTGLSFLTASLIYIASKDNVYIEKVYN